MIPRPAVGAASCCDSGSPVASRSRTACENASGVAARSRASAQVRVEGRSRTTTGLPVARYSLSLSGCIARVTGRSAYGMISTAAVWRSRVVPRTALPDAGPRAAAAKSDGCGSDSGPTSTIVPWSGRSPAAQEGDVHPAIDHAPEHDQRALELFERMKTRASVLRLQKGALSTAVAPQLSCGPKSLTAPSHRSQCSRSTPWVSSWTRRRSSLSFAWSVSAHRDQDVSPLDQSVLHLAKRRAIESRPFGEVVDTVVHPAAHGQAADQIGDDRDVRHARSAALGMAAS